MEDINNASDFFMNSLLSFWDTIARALPGIISAILIFLAGWFLAKLVSKVVLKLLNRLKFDHLAGKMNATEFLNKANLIMTPAELVSKFLYYLIMLLVFTTVSDMMGWSRVSIEISKLLSYLPNLFFAVVFFVIGTYIAQFIRSIITGATATLGMSTGKIIGNVVFYFLFIVVVITSLDQAGMDTTIISSNVLLIIGTILLALGISYGVASIEFVKNILAGFFTRKTYKVGQLIEIDNEKGEILDITNVALTLKKSNGDLVLIPTNMLVKNKVTIFKT